MEYRLGVSCRKNAYAKGWAGSLREGNAIVIRALGATILVSNAHSQLCLIEPPSTKSPTGPDNPRSGP